LKELDFQTVFLAAMMNPTLRICTCTQIRHPEAVLPFKSESTQKPDETNVHGITLTGAGASSISQQHEESQVSAPAFPSAGGASKWQPASFFSIRRGPFSNSHGVHPDSGDGFHEFPDAVQPLFCRKPGAQL
jgi:hypothetical protein